MSEGTGSGALDTFVEDVFNLTGGVGLFDFEKGKGFKAGKAGEAIVQGTKEVTGAAAAEDANALAREQFEQDKARLTKERADAQATNQRRQITASKGAAGARGNTSTTTGGQGTSLNNTQTDFLGL